MAATMRFGMRCMDMSLRESGVHTPDQDGALCHYAALRLRALRLQSAECRERDPFVTIPALTHIPPWDIYLPRSVRKVALSCGVPPGATVLQLDAMDAWVKEAEKAKDPVKVSVLAPLIVLDDAGMSDGECIICTGIPQRISVVDSPRHVRVEVSGVEVANTTKPLLLFERGLPACAYIPQSDCNAELLKPTDLQTHCPYKGDASYYSVELPSGQRFENIVWYYPEILPGSEATNIKGYVSFYDTKADIYVD